MVENPYPITSLIWTLIFTWYVVWWDSKNGDQKDNVYLERIELHAQNMVSILSSIINKVERTYVKCNEHYNLHFDAEKKISYKL